MEILARRRESAREKKGEKGLSRIEASRKVRKPTSQTRTWNGKDKKSYAKQQKDENARGKRIKGAIAQLMNDV